MTGTEKVDLAIRGAVVVSDGAYPRDILIRGGRISALVEAGASVAKQEIDAQGLLALPGMVDAHVHFNDPGRSEWEGWASGSRAAAAGGTTTVLDMPLNSIPPVLDGDSFDQKVAAAENVSVVDFGLWGGLVDADPASLRADERGAVGVKAFLCDSGGRRLPRDTRRRPRAGAPSRGGRGFDRGASLRDEALVREPPRASGHGRHDPEPGRYRDRRRRSSSRRARVRAAREAGARIHIVHLSAVEALGAIGAARDMGTDVTAEPAPIT